MDLEILDWSGISNFSYDGMVRKKEIGDGSCFFHSFADSFYRPYKLGEVDKRKFVKSIRHQLSELLGSKNERGIVWYYTLSRGKLLDYSKQMPDFTLENMQALLDSSNSIDNRFNEFISNVFNKDIYIIDGTTRDVYITGDDDEILYKGRESVVLLYYNRNHYDLVGILDDDRLITLFKPNHPFILQIRARMSVLRKKIIK